MFIEGALRPGISCALRFEIPNIALQKTTSQTSCVSFLGIAIEFPPKRLFHCLRRRFLLTEGKLDVFFNFATAL